MVLPLFRSSNHLSGHHFRETEIYDNSWYKFQHGSRVVKGLEIAFLITIAHKRRYSLWHKPCNYGFNHVNNFLIDSAI